jgi:hypothetical protein
MVDIAYLRLYHHLMADRYPGIERREDIRQGEIIYLSSG